MSRKNHKKEAVAPTGEANVGPLYDAPNDRDAVKVVPLGGCGEFGMNMTTYLFRNRLYVVDCGVRFPDPIKLGTDAIIPHVDPFFDRAGGPFAYIMTHGHEDHIGALPYILPRWPAPVYGTQWTLELIRNKFARRGLDPDRFSLIRVDAGDRIAGDDFNIEYIHVNHSIPMTCALMIRTPKVNIFHTGDFKFDDRPVIEPPADWVRIQAAARDGVDFLITDSTNSQAAGDCPGEASVLEPLIKTFKAAPAAVVISTFASNLWRLKTIVDACEASGRRLFVTGPGVEQTFAIAEAVGLYNVPAGIRLDDMGVARIARNKLVVLATGCQGEYRSALVRIAARQHRSFKIEEGDTVVLSSRIIPGNEKSIYYMMNDFLSQGAHVVTAREAPGIHVSGHAYSGDLLKLVSALRPKNYTPMHGGFSQLLANWNVGRSIPESKETSRIIQNGDVLQVSAEGVEHLGTLEVETRYVDGESGVVLPPDVLKERLKLGELGGALVTGAYNLKDRKWVAPPRVDLIGLHMPRGTDPEQWLDTAATSVRTRLPQLVTGGLSQEDAFEEMRISLRRQLSQVLKKKPVVLIKVQLL